MTIERASELVASLQGDAKIDLFCHFEQLLNPHDVQTEACANWQCMFAEMCGFTVVSNVQEL